MSTETLEQNQSQQENGNNESLALKVADGSSLLPGNRPVESKHLQIVHTYSSVGAARPVTKSDLDIKGTLTVSGTRPITASHLQISDNYKIMGNRPVASNHIDDPITLMGFLD